jgi:transcription elongation GreA/GreB family factor
MTDQGKIQFKDQLKQYCRSLIEQRITAAKTAIANAQQAANSEEKSSAGDKYETGRAMGHLEKDMYARQLAENIKELAGLDAVNSHLIYESVTTGAFIQCTDTSFFIAAGLGKQTMNGQTIFFLSPHAPLARTLFHKKTGESFFFNGKDIVITRVF